MRSEPETPNAAEVNDAQVHAPVPALETTPDMRQHITHCLEMEEQSVGLPPEQSLPPGEHW